MNNKELKEELKNIPKDKYIYQRYNGIISKYIDNGEYYINVETGIATLKDHYIFLGKTSENPIDLIEVSDYVNGRKVYQVGYNFQDDFVCKMSNSNYEDFIYPEEIKTIVTKEQFESMEYKIEEG